MNNDRMIWECPECGFSRPGDRAEACGDDWDGELVGTGPWCGECEGEMIEAAEAAGGESD